MNELRMYFFVPYQLTGIQQGIQSGHAALEFALRYGRYNPNHIIWNFIEKYKTWVILNGGTTNLGYNGSEKGSLDLIWSSMIDYNVSAQLDDKLDMERFYEPDLNDAMTAICFVCDERVFNKELYPNFMDWVLDVKMYPTALMEMPKMNENMLRRLPKEKYTELFPEYYQEWTEFVGGEKNVFLRELINGKKLA